MKFNWKRLAALLLAAVLLLSLTAWGEEEITIAGDASANAVDIEDVLSIDDALVEPDELLDESLELNLSSDILNPLEESTIEPSDIPVLESGEQEESNASDGITLGIQETYKLSTKGLGKKLSFKSSKPKVVSVSGKGIIEGLKKGTAKITILSGTTVKKTYTVHVVAAPNKIVLPSKSITLGAKESVTIEPKITWGSHTTFTWATNNKAVATVSKGGKITAKKAGKANITVKTHNGKKAVLKVTVAKAPASVSLNKTTASLQVGDTLRLKATLPKGTASSRLTWKSNDTDVVTVTEKGIVTAIGSGTAKISVTTYNGKKAFCKVTVEEETPAPTSIVLDEDDALMLAGTGFYLHATVYPEDAETELTWSSSNASDISVDQNGYVHANNYGKAVITVTTDNGLSASCNVESTDMEVGIFIDEPISKVIDRMPIDLIHNDNIYHSLAYDVAFVVDDYNIVTAVSIHPSNPVGRFEIFGIWSGMTDDDCENVLDNLGFRYIGMTDSGMYVYELGSYRIGIEYNVNYRVEQCMLIRRS